LLDGPRPAGAATAPDQALAERLRRRDGSALAALYDQYGSMVYAIALRIVRVGADAEEVTQEVFLYAWEKAALFDSTRGTLLAWLATKARSRAIDRLRQHKSQERREDALARSLEPLAALSAPRSGPEHEFALAEARHVVRRALDQLPPAERETIEIAYFEGLSQSEIAARTNTPLGTVKTRMRQGLLRLRAAMGPLLAEESAS
jgi:RNA polymerase sigma-70 factor (ECF subfamily)